MVGEFPGLTKGLDRDGNLRATSDFRSVYSSLVEQWFDVDAAKILPDAQEDAAPEARRMRPARALTADRRSRAGVAAAVVGAARPQARPPRSPSSRSSEKEFTLTLSRPAVQRGTVSVELVNFGMDTHDLIVLQEDHRARSRSLQAARPPRARRTAR